MENFIFFGILAIPIILIIIAAGIHKRSQDKSHGPYSSVASSVGLYFRDKSPSSPYESDFPLFSKGIRREFEDVIYGKMDEIDVKIFVYKYEEIRGTNSLLTANRQSFVLLQSSNINLPKFTLHPEDIFHKIGSIFGYQDIDFNSHQEFSSKYLLRGDDEVSIRKLFNNAVLLHFTKNTRICVEACRDKFLYYHPRGVIRPKDIRSFLDEGMLVFNLFRNSQSL